MSGPGLLPQDPLGLGAAMEALPEAAHTSPGGLLNLYRLAYARLCAELSDALALRMGRAQLAEYTAAAHYQHLHPGTGEHTRAWIGANLPSHAAEIAAACVEAATARACLDMRAQSCSRGPSRLRQGS